MQYCISKIVSYNILGHFNKSNIKLRIFIYIRSSKTIQLQYMLCKKYAMLFINVRFARCCYKYFFDAMCSCPVTITPHFEKLNLTWKLPFFAYMSVIFTFNIHSLNNVCCSATVLLLGTWKISEWISITLLSINNWSIKGNNVVSYRAVYDRMILYFLWTPLISCKSLF